MLLNTNSFLICRKIRNAFSKTRKANFVLCTGSRTHRNVDAQKRGRTNRRENIGMWNQKSFWLNFQKRHRHSKSYCQDEYNIPELQLTSPSLHFTKLSVPCLHENNKSRLVIENQKLQRPWSCIFSILKIDYRPGFEYFTFKDINKIRTADFILPNIWVAIFSHITPTNLVIICLQISLIMVQESVKLDVFRLQAMCNSK